MRMEKASEFTGKLLPELLRPRLLHYRMAGMQPDAAMVIGMVLACHDEPGEAPP
jgi:hypothetical protein